MRRRRFTVLAYAMFLVVSYPPPSCGFLWLSLVTQRVSSFQKRSPESRFRSRPVATVIPDEYDQFADSFEQHLRHWDDDDDSIAWQTGAQTAEFEATASDKENQNKNGEEEELSRYYRRDRRPNATSLIQPLLQRNTTARRTLQQLLDERYRARRVRDFERVAQVDGRLLQECSVRAYDHPPIWSGISAPPPAAHLRRQAEKQRQQLQALHEPTGHPYRQVVAVEQVSGDKTRHSSAYRVIQHPTARSIENDAHCSLSLSDIHRLLSRLTGCLLFQPRLQQRRRMEQADAIRFELLLHGVSVQDDCKVWTTDPSIDLNAPPVVAAIQRAVIEPGEGTNYELPVYTELKDINMSGRVALADMENDDLRTRQRVKQLLEIRSQALIRGETQLACYLAFELCQTYQVGHINDELFTWHWVFNEIEPGAQGERLLSKILKQEDSAVSSRRTTVFPPLLFVRDDRSATDTPTYHRSQRSKKLEDERLLGRVSDLVLERIHKREEGKYLEADAIRKELWYTYGVGVNDRLGQFSVGGEYDRPTNSLPLLDNT